MFSILDLLKVGSLRDWDSTEADRACTYRAMIFMYSRVQCPRVRHILFFSYNSAQCTHLNEHGSFYTIVIY